MPRRRRTTDDDDGGSRRTLLVGGAAAIVLVAVAALLFTGGPPEQVWGDADTGLEAYSDGTVFVDARNASGGQGVPGAESITVTNEAATMGRHFILQGSYRGTLFREEHRVNGTTLLSIDNEVTPGDGVPDAYIVPRFVDTDGNLTFSATIYVDQAFRDTMQRRPLVVYGWEMERATSFSPTERYEGVYTMTVTLPGADRIRYSPTAQPRVAVGDFVNATEAVQAGGRHTYVMLPRVLIHEGLYDLSVGVLREGHQ